MLRYCKNCQKEYDFKISSVKDLEHLICPECGNPIDKDSKKPIEGMQNHQMETAIGKAYSGMIYVGIVTILLCTILGSMAYLLKWNFVLYVVTLIGLAAYGFIYGVLNLNVIYPVLGGICGFVLFHSLTGICFGMIIGIFVRRILTTIIWKAISFLVKWSKK